MSLTRITSDLIKDGTVAVADLASATKTAISGSSASGSVSTRTTALETASGSFSTRITNATASINSISSSQATRTANLVIASSSLSSSVATLKGSGTLQSVATNASPTFAGATITGTLTAQEVHTEFESASVIFSSGSTIFGDTADDIHQMTGSLRVITNAETNVVKFHNDGGDQNRDVMILQGGADSGPGNTRFITFNDGDGGAFGFIQGPANGATAGISFNTTADTSLLTLSGSRVGIGTVNPASSLHVQAANPTVYITNTTQDGASTLLRMTEKKEVDGDAGGFFRYVGSNNWFEIGTNISSTDTVHFYLPRDGSGKVGIGTSSPLATLHVEHTTDDTDENGNIGLTVGGGASGDVRHYFGVNNSSNYAYYGAVEHATQYVPLVLQPNGSKVGIGTTNPVGKLQIQTTSNGSVDEALTLDTSQTSVGSGTMIRFTGNNRGHVGANIKAVIQANSQEKTSLLFDVNNGSTTNTVMTIDHTQKVGIGTTGPATILDVDSGASSDIVKFQNNSSTSGLVIGYSTDLCSFDLGASQALRIRQSSSVPFLLNTNGVMDGDFNDTSDIALKKDIEDLTATIDGVKALKPSTFQWIDELKGDRTKIGFIAQDVEEQFPELVDGEDGRKSINTIGLVSVLTKTIQDLIKRIEELEK